MINGSVWLGVISKVMNIIPMAASDHKMYNIAYVVGTSAFAIKGIRRQRFNLQGNLNKSHLHRAEVRPPQSRLQAQSTTAPVISHDMSRHGQRVAVTRVTCKVCCDQYGQGNQSERLLPLRRVLLLATCVHYGFSMASILVCWSLRVSAFGAHKWPVEPVLRKQPADDPPRMGHRIPECLVLLDACR